MARVRLCVCGSWFVGREGQAAHTHVHRRAGATGVSGPVCLHFECRGAPTRVRVWRCEGRPPFLPYLRKRKQCPLCPPTENQSPCPWPTKPVPLPHGKSCSPSNKGEKESIAGPENRPAKIVRPFRTAKAVPPSNKGENQSPEIVPPNRPPPSGFPFQHGHHACCRSCCGGRSGP